MRLLSVLSSAYQATGLALVLLAIPLAFDVGGVDCGVAFTFILSVFYFVLCTLRLAFRRTFLQPVASLLYHGQFVILPSLLLLHLSQYPVRAAAVDKLVFPWRFGLEYATGVFAILEGLCVLIIVQFCGRVSSALTRRSDGFLLAQLVLASLLITADLYLLLRIYMLPGLLGAATATLIGAALSVSLIVGVYGIWSRRGNVAESTLLFSYIVYQVYLTLTDFQTASSAHAEGILDSSAGSSSAGVAWLLSFLRPPLDPPARGHAKYIDPELPPEIMAGLADFMTQVAELTPTGIKTIFEFLRVTTSSVTPSVGVSLVVRLASYFIAMRLVPYASSRASWDRARTPRCSGWILLIYSYSPVLIIMVYTHLLLQHTSRIVHGSALPLDFAKIWANSRQAWQFWGWANAFTILALYAAELAMSPVGDGPGTPVDVDDALPAEI